MAIDYREKEREFLDGLEEATGRGLEAWMALISEQNFSHRNALIDWLRQQGFMFSKASWLERVHHNGGKPIYSGVSPARSQKSRERIQPSKPISGDERAAADPNPPAPVVRQIPQALEPAEASAMNSALATAKGLRPLAQALVRQIQNAVPEAGVTPFNQQLNFNHKDRDFGVLVMGAKELRLGLALGRQPATAPWLAAKFPNPALKIDPSITHMLIVNDVRQITPDVIRLVSAAANT